MSSPEGEPAPKGRQSDDDSQGEGDDSQEDEGEDPAIAAFDIAAASVEVAVRKGVDVVSDSAQVFSNIAAITRWQAWVKGYSARTIIREKEEIDELTGCSTDHIYHLLEAVTSAYIARVRRSGADVAHALREEILTFVRKGYDTCRHFEIQAENERKAEEARIHNAAVKIQSRYKGYLWRKNFKDRIQEERLRLRLATNIQTGVEVSSFQSYLLFVKASENKRKKVFDLTGTPRSVIKKVMSDATRDVSTITKTEKKEKSNAGADGPASGEAGKPSQSVQLPKESEKQARKKVQPRLSIQQQLLKKRSLVDLAPVAAYIERITRGRRGNEMAINFISQNKKTVKDLAARSPSRVGRDILPSTRFSVPDSLEHTVQLKGLRLKKSELGIEYGGTVDKNQRPKSEMYEDAEGQGVLHKLLFPERGEEEIPGNLEADFSYTQSTTLVDTFLPGQHTYNTNASQSPSAQSTARLSENYVRIPRGELCMPLRHGLPPCKSCSSCPVLPWLNNKNRCLCCAIQEDANHGLTVFPRCVDIFEEWFGDQRSALHLEFLARDLTIIYNYLAQQHLSRGEFKMAYGILNKCLSTIELVRMPDVHAAEFKAWTLMHMSIYYCGIRTPELAYECCLGALELEKETPMWNNVETIMIHAASALSAVKNFEGSVKILDAALKLADETLSVLDQRAPPEKIYDDLVWVRRMKLLVKTAAFHNLSIDYFMMNKYGKAKNAHNQAEITSKMVLEEDSLWLEEIRCVGECLVDLDAPPSDQEESDEEEGDGNDEREKQEREKQEREKQEIKMEPQDRRRSVSKVKLPTRPIAQILPTYVPRTPYDEGWMDFDEVVEKDNRDMTNISIILEGGMPAATTKTIPPSPPKRGRVSTSKKSNISAAKISFCDTEENIEPDTARSDDPETRAPVLIASRAPGYFRSSPSPFHLTSKSPIRRQLHGRRRASSAGGNRLMKSPATKWIPDSTPVRPHMPPVGLALKPPSPISPFPPGVKMGGWEAKPLSHADIRSAAPLFANGNRPELRGRVSPCVLRDGEFVNKVAYEHDVTDMSPLFETRKRASEFADKYTKLSALPFEISDSIHKAGYTDVNMARPGTGGLRRKSSPPFSSTVTLRMIDGVQVVETPAVAAAMSPAQPAKAKKSRPTTRPRVFPGPELRPHGVSKEKVLKLTQSPEWYGRGLPRNPRSIGMF